MDLTPDLLIRAYCQGIFPMAEQDGSISWYAPDPRAVFDLDSFHVPSRLARTIRQGRFEVRINHDFSATMADCAQRSETWISPQIIDLYSQLHHMGLAHSVETFSDGERVGGLYGVSLGGAFMGESMFSRKTDASKVALVYLVERLKKQGFVLLDTQFMTDHLARFGAIHIALEDYLKRLVPALKLPCRFD